MSANNQDIRKPEKGQESNENWDDQPQKNSEDTTSISQSIEDQHASTAASSQRNKRDNVAPLDADFEQLPSEKRMPDSNQTGPGLG
jgi:hypothetical protein